MVTLFYVLPIGARPMTISHWWIRELKQCLFAFFFSSLLLTVYKPQIICGKIFSTKIYLSPLHNEAPTTPEFSKVFEFLPGACLLKKKNWGTRRDSLYFAVIFSFPKIHFDLDAKIANVVNFFLN